ncbi:zinc finger protein 577-like [Sceloporus undulatus]|uniref:zinc finger protein 577-like n=1 Tax=Sceloporus undulatus TaxID=8520 RepID=UPI001C4BCAAF|nr:zinc finger protein 577-like [Sceloporus undulatus]
MEARGRGVLRSKMVSKHMERKEATLNFSSMEETAGENTLEQMTFEDVAVFFTEDEWEMLNQNQRSLYEEVMMENYENVSSLASVIEGPQ